MKTVTLSSAAERVGAYSQCRLRSFQQLFSFAFLARTYGERRIVKAAREFNYRPVEILRAFLCGSGALTPSA